MAEPIQIVVVGGGFGGMYCARRLQRRLRGGDAEVTVVNPRTTCCTRRWGYPTLHRVRRWLPTPVVIAKEGRRVPGEKRGLAYIASPPMRVAELAVSGRPRRLTSRGPGWLPASRGSMFPGPRPRLACSG